MLNPFVPQSVTRALDAAEAFADGAISAELLVRVDAVAARAFEGASDMAALSGTGYLRHLADAVHHACGPQNHTGRAPGKAALASARAAGDVPWPATGEFHRGHPDELANQAELLRDLFGNPFRSVGLEPEWLTGTVLALARGIYAEPAFDRLPILADALQDAGCDEEELLAHCREPREHARGCWVVDMLLGKS